MSDESRIGTSLGAFVGCSATTKLTQSLGRGPTEIADTTFSGSLRPESRGVADRC